MSLVLVTGATGFVGRRLTRCLIRGGFDVAALVRPGADTRSLRQLGARLVVGDVCHADSLAAAVDGVDAVCHLAGRTRARGFAEFAKVNAVGCENLARACSQGTTSTMLVIVSSLAAGGPSAPGRPRTEADPDAPVSDYGRSKLAGEKAALRFADQVSITTVRPPVVFGPGDRTGLTLFRAIERTGLHIVPRRELPLSLVYVDDLSQVLSRLVKRQPAASGECYYVADPAVTTFAGMGEFAAAALNRRVRTLPIRAGWFYLAATVCELVGRIRQEVPLINFDKLRELQVTGWVCDAAKIQLELGSLPAKPLEARFAETAQWYRSHGWL